MKKKKNPRFIKKVFCSIILPNIWKKIPRNTRKRVIILLFVPTLNMMTGCVFASNVVTKME